MGQRQTWNKCRVIRRSLRISYILVDRDKLTPETPAPVHDLSFTESTTLEGVLTLQVLTRRAGPFGCVVLDGVRCLIYLHEGCYLQLSVDERFLLQTSTYAVVLRYTLHNRRGEVIV